MTVSQLRFKFLLNNVLVDVNAGQNRRGALRNNSSRQLELEREPSNLRGQTSNCKPTTAHSDDDKPETTVEPYGCHLWLNCTVVKVGSFVKDEERRHDDVSGVFGWIRVVSLEQAKVGDGVGPAHVELEEEDRSRHAVNITLHLQQWHESSVRAPSGVGRGQFQMSDSEMLLPEITVGKRT